MEIKRTKTERYSRIVGYIRPLSQAVKELKEEVRNLKKND